MIELARGSTWMVGKRHVLTFTARGNLELWQTPELKLLWETATTDKGAKLAMQGDGNLVIYGKDGQSVWASGTFGHEQAFLGVQDDGRLVIYSADLSETLWESAPAQIAPAAEEVEATAAVETDQPAQE